MNPQAVDVLLVEDNLYDAELTITELTKFRMANNLVHVSDGEEALDWLFAIGKYTSTRDVSHLPKIVLLDIKMPKLNGFEVLSRIRSDVRTKTTPVVMLTSSNQDPDIHKCYALGANSYIVKPVNFDKFSEAIRDLGCYWLLLNQTYAN
ncbi:MAG TPA: response regulator [Flavitalea sp.]|nr:response regulator [Flavitalea sp.]